MMLILLGGHGIFHMPKITSILLCAVAGTSPFILGFILLAICSLSDENLRRKVEKIRPGTTLTILMAELGDPDDLLTERSKVTCRYTTLVSLRQYVFVFESGILVEREMLQSW